MSVRVGTVLNIIKAWGSYQSRMGYYRKKLVEVQLNNDEAQVKYWTDTVKMTNAEIGQFLDMEI